MAKSKNTADAPPDPRFAMVEKQRGAICIVALSPAAAVLGLLPGMALANARAQLPDLTAHDHDPHADQVWLEGIADICERYTPMTAIDPPDGLVLDITGCTHLFASEAALAADIEVRFAGLHLRHAYADTPKAAQALARFQTYPAASGAAAIRRLPVAALRLDDETQTALRRAGLATIADLADRPTAPLSARFGTEASAALDRLLGRADSRITPRRALPALIVERRFAEPIARTEAALAILDDLVAEASNEMERRGCGGRRFAARFYRSDGALADLAVETSLPVREPAAVIRLPRADRFALRSDRPRLRLRHDPSRRAGARGDNAVATRTGGRHGWRGGARSPYRPPGRKAGARTRAAARPARQSSARTRCIRLSRCRHPHHRFMVCAGARRAAAPPAPLVRSAPADRGDGRSAQRPAAPLPLAPHVARCDAA
jgi:nucleotidyltransferase/DNA polymerase involved in DNA repair